MQETTISSCSGTEARRARSRSLSTSAHPCRNLRSFVPLLFSPGNEQQRNQATKRTRLWFLVVAASSLHSLPTTERDLRMSRSHVVFRVFRAFRGLKNLPPNLRVDLQAQHGQNELDAPLDAPAGHELSLTGSAFVRRCHHTVRCGGKS